MSNNYEVLIQAKKKIEQSKATLSELKGQKEATLTTLKDEYSCSSLEEANALLESISGKIDVLKTSVQEKMDKLQKEYPQLFEDEE